MLQAAYTTLKKKSHEFIISWRSEEVTSTTPTLAGPTPPPPLRTMPPFNTTSCQRRCKMSRTRHVSTAGCGCSSQLAIATCLRTVQSAAYIADWMQYHQAVGLTHHVWLLLDNTTTDQTERMVEPYLRQGFVQSVQRSALIRTGVPQLKKCVQQVVDDLPNGTWYVTIDEDKYLVPLQSPSGNAISPGLSVQQCLRDDSLLGVRCITLERYNFASIVDDCASSSHVIDRFKLRSKKTLFIDKTIYYRPHSFLLPDGKVDWKWEVRHRQHRGPPVLDPCVC